MSLNESMNEIIFLVEESEEGGYVARALGESIITQGETIDELKEQVKDAVRCHFESPDLLQNIKLNFV